MFEFFYDLVFKNLIVISIIFSVSSLAFLISSLKLFLKDRKQLKLAKAYDKKKLQESIFKSADRQINSTAQLTKIPRKLKRKIQQNKDQIFTQDNFSEVTQHIPGNNFDSDPFLTDTDAKLTNFITLNGSNTHKNPWFIDLDLGKNFDTFFEKQELFELLREVNTITK